MTAFQTRYNKDVKSINAYIQSFPKNVAVKLETIRRLVKQAAPAAVEVISYQIPAFRLDGMLLYYAAFQRHVGFYPNPSTIKAFRKELTGYKTAKGSVQFPHDLPLPVPLIRKMVRFRVQEKSTEQTTNKGGWKTCRGGHKYRTAACPKCWPNSRKRTR